MPKVDYSALILSYEVGLVKPDPQIYRLATKKARVEASEICFIDDREENIIEAQRSGWQGFVFNQNKPEELLSAIDKLLSTG